MQINSLAIRQWPPGGRLIQHVSLRREEESSDRKRKEGKEESSDRKEVTEQGE